MRWWNHALAILAKRCPVCLRGAMFKSLFTMHDNCPVCGHRFMREEGFFQGAMFVSYTVGVFEFAFVALVAYVLVGSVIGVLGALILAIGIHLILVPQVFQYSRVLWAHVNVGTGAKKNSE